ncbi:hypothetical protein [Streptomyces sp. NPDC002758]
MSNKHSRRIAKLDAANTVMRKSIQRSQGQRYGKGPHIPQRSPRMLPVVEQESGTD